MNAIAQRSHLRDDLLTGMEWSPAQLRGFLPPGRGYQSPPGSLSHGSRGQHFCPDFRKAVAAHARHVRGGYREPRRLIDLSGPYGHTAR